MTAKLQLNPESKENLTDYEGDPVACEDVMVIQKLDAKVTYICQSNGHQHIRSMKERAVTATRNTT
jgi:hypothetical protein